MAGSSAAGGVGPWQAAWKRHRRYAAVGTWDRVRTRLLAWADAAGQVHWKVSAGATIARVTRWAGDLQGPEGRSAVVIVTHSRSVVAGLLD